MKRAMGRKKAVEVLIQAAASKISGAGCGIPGGHVFSPTQSREVASAIRTCWKWIYGHELGFSECYNLGIPSEFMGQMPGVKR